MAIATAKDSAGRMTLRIDAPILARLDEYHKKTEIPKTRIINRALKNYLDEMDEDFADARGRSGLAGIHRQRKKVNFPRSTCERIGSFWRYRVGDYRVICDINDNEL